MNIEHVIFANVMAVLPYGLKERLRLDVTNRPPYFSDNNVNVLAIQRTYSGLDFICDMRNDLNSLT